MGIMNDNHNLLYTIFSQGVIPNTFQWTGQPGPKTLDLRTLNFDHSEMITGILPGKALGISNHKQAKVTNGDPTLKSWIKQLNSKNHYYQVSKDEPNFGPD